MSCCTCGNCCQPGYGCLCQIVLPDNPVVGYSAANINTLGIGVYDSQSGNEFDFRGIYSGNSSIVIALDAGNNAISITLNIDQIIDDLPQATTTQRGVGETATDAEAIAKASITMFLTPSNLAALGASLTFAGLVELATDAETQAGVSVTLAVTPAGLASVITTLEQTTTWADAAARAVLVPSFAGQFGVQLDTDIPYISTTTLAGGFNRPLFTLNSANNVISSATTVDLVTGARLIFDSSDVSGGIELDVELDVTSGGSVKFNGGVLNFDSPGSSFLQIGGAAANANSVMIISGTAGDLTTVATIGTFISTFDVQVGYTAFVNGAVLRTCDTTTVTLPQLAQIVGTLIEDLKAVQLPAV